MKKMKKLSVVTLLRIVLLSVILAVGIILAVAHVVKRETLKTYEEFSFSYTNTLEGYNLDICIGIVYTNHIQ